MPMFRKLVPMLQTKNMGQTIGWYEKVLGFQQTSPQVSGWCCLSRDGVSYGATIWVRCARPSWRVPAGASPARVRGSARLVVSVASWEVTTAAKRTQRLFGVWE
jgi:hypothetical protein